MEDDRKYKRIGWVTALLSQVLLLILFYFLIAWREPSPPIPSYGIELSFGFTETGAGDEPVTTTNTEDVVEEVETEEQVEEAEDEVQEVEAQDAEPEEAEEIITEQPSPDVAAREPEEEQPVEEPVPAKEEKQPASAPNPTGDPDIINNDSKGTEATPGDQGKEEALDDRALYGNQGSGDGASLQMAGWTWDAKPKPDDQSAESGKIVYRIKIDDEGYIIDIEVISNTVTPALERLYRQSVEKLTFSKTNDYKPSPTTTGKITFLIQTR